MRPHHPRPHLVSLIPGALRAAARVSRGRLRVSEREGLILPPPRRATRGFRGDPGDTTAMNDPASGFLVQVLAGGSHAAGCQRA